MDRKAVNHNLNHAYTNFTGSAAVVTVFISAAKQTRESTEGCSKSKVREKNDKFGKKEWS